MNPGLDQKVYLRLLHYFEALTPLLLTLAALLPVAPPGFFPQAVSPYLNGAFPSSTTGLGTGSGNWISVNAYPDLTFDNPLAMIQILDLSGFYIYGKPGNIWKIGNDTTIAAPIVSGHYQAGIQLP